MRRRLTGWPAHLAPHLLFLIPELLMAAGPLVVAMSTDASGQRRFRMPDFFYGGQALIEGVMMRGRTTVAMSVRPPSGEIVTMSEPLPAALRPTEGSCGPRSCAGSSCCTRRSSSARGC